MVRRMVTRLLEAAARKFIAHRRLYMRAKVNDDYTRWRRTVWMIFVRLLIGIVVVSVVQLVMPGPVAFVASMAVSVATGYYFTMGSYDRTQAYTDGWHDGRRAFHDSFREARDRGIGIYDWYDLEREKTWGTHL